VDGRTEREREREREREKEREREGRREGVKCPVGKCEEPILKSGQVENSHGF
jgi:hypothetical protein